MFWVVRRTGTGKVLGRITAPPDRGQAALLARKRYGARLTVQSDVDYQLEQEEAEAARRHRRQEEVL